MSLTLGFCLYQREYLRAGLHQFCLVQHTSAARKVLKACIDQHQVIAGGGGAPMLADTAYLKAPDRVSLKDTLEIAQSSHT